MSIQVMLQICTFTFFLMLIVSILSLHHRSIPPYSRRVNVLFRGLLGTPNTHSIRYIVLCLLYRSCLGGIEPCFALPQLGVVEVSIFEGVEQRDDI